MTSHIAQVVLTATLLVLNKEDGTLTMLEPDSGKVTATVQTGDGPHEVAVSKDGRFAYVANYGSRTPGSSLSVIDLRAKTEKRVDISPLQRPHGIAVGRDGKVYFTAESNKTVARLDPASGKVDEQYPTGQTGTHMVLFTGDGSRMITTNMGSNSVSILKPGSEPVHIQTGDGPEGLDVSPNGRELWVANSRGGSITPVDLTKSAATGTFDIGTKRSNRLKFSPDGKIVLVSDMEGGQLVVIDVTGRKVVKRIEVGRMPEGILIPSGGKRAFVAVSGANQLAVVDLKTLEITARLETGGRSPDGMAWLK
jgi:YVTN family beta-propeller protein